MLREIAANDEYNRGPTAQIKTSPKQQNEGRVSRIRRSWNRATGLDD